MASTAIPAVKAALVNRLEETTELDEIEIASGGREPSTVRKVKKGDEYVWIWRGRSKRDPASLGRRPAPLKENIEITCRLVIIGGDDPEARAFELFEVVETALRGFPDLGRKVRFQSITSLEEEARDFDRTLGHHILFTVSAEAVI